MLPGNRERPRGDKLIVGVGGRGVIVEVAVFAGNSRIGVHISNRRSAIFFCFFQRVVVVFDQNAAVSIPVGA